MIRNGEGENPAEKSQYGPRAGLRHARATLDRLTERFV